MSFLQLLAIQDGLKSKSRYFPVNVPAAILTHATVCFEWSTKFSLLIWKKTNLLGGLLLKYLWLSFRSVAWCMHTSFYSWMQKRSEHWKILSKLTKLSQQKFLFKKTLPFVKLLQSIWFIDYALTIVTHAVSMMKNAENANGDGSTEGDYYISYRRRSPLQGDECATIATIVFGTGKKHIQIDSLWVVPHSPELIRKLHCHLNAELCISRIGLIN